MLIPVRCVTCGRVLANMWRRYLALLSAAAAAADAAADGPDGLIGTPQARIFDDMGIDKICCRRHMLTNVDAMDRI